MTETLIDAIIDETQALADRIRAAEAQLVRDLEEATQLPEEVVPRVLEQRIVRSWGFLLGLMEAWLILVDREWITEDLQVAHFLDVRMEQTP